MQHQKEPLWKVNFIIRFQGDMHAADLGRKKTVYPWEVIGTVV